MLDRLAQMFIARYGYSPEIHYDLRSKLSAEHADLMLVDRPYWFALVCYRIKDFKARFGL